MCFHQITVYLFWYINEKIVKGISYIFTIGYEFSVIVKVLYFLGNFFININNVFNLFCIFGGIFLSTLITSLIPCLILFSFSFFLRKIHYSSLLYLIK